MVGRFVEQQQVGLDDQRTRQQRATAGAARKRRERRIGRQPETRDDTLDTLAQHPAATGLEAVLHVGEARQAGRIVVALDGMAQAVELGEQRAELAQAAGDDVEGGALEHRAGALLGEPADTQPGAGHDLASLRFDLAGDQAQQRRLAGAVAPDQAEPLAAVDRQPGPVEQRAPGQVVTDVSQGQQHGRVATEGVASAG